METIFHVQFPGLGLEFTLDRVALSLGGFNIYWYGVLIALGLILGMALAFHYAPDFGLNADRLVDVVVVGTIMGIVCARIAYVAMAPFEYESIWDMIAVRDGGLAIYGGVIGAVLTLLVFTRVRKLSFLSMADTGCLGLITGQIIGRWGNFFNCEAFGGYTDSLLAMQIRRGLVNETMISQELLNHLVVENGVEYIQVHPTFLYESLWNLAVLGFMLWYRKYKKFDGEMFCIYLLGYGLGRAWIEGLRTDQLILFGTGIPVSQALSLVLAAAAALVLAAGHYQSSKRA